MASAVYKMLRLKNAGELITLHRIASGSKATNYGSTSLSTGRITIYAFKGHSTRTALNSTIRHEMVHSTMHHVFGRSHTWAYMNSRIFRTVEELVAETIGQGSINKAWQWWRRVKSKY